MPLVPTPRASAVTAPLFFAFGLAACACRSEPPAAPSVSPKPQAPPPSAAATQPAEVSPSPFGPAIRAYYAAQGEVAPPAEMARLLPGDLPHKTVERSLGRGMDLMKATPGRRFATVTLLTLSPAEQAAEVTAKHLTSLGFVADKSTPNEAAFAHPDGQRVTVSPRVVEGQPLRLFLRWTAADSELDQTLTSLSPEVALGLKEMSPVGHEESLLHAVVTGGSVTDSARVVLLLRAPSPAVRTRALAAWTQALASAGFTNRPTRPELWERPSTRELLVVRPTDDPAGDVLVSHQRRFRR